MTKKFIIKLNLTEEQLVILKSLQSRFIEVCNSISPVVLSNRCWNRVVLHHMVYHPMRQMYPDLGSQMICNAIYSVCRAYRALLKFDETLLTKLDGVSAIVFSNTAPVFFDRHTLTLLKDKLSIYTLGGRMKVSVDLSVSDREHFNEEKLKEILLIGTGNEFSLHFYFGEHDHLNFDLVTEENWPDNLLVSYLPTQENDSLTMVTL